MSSTLRPRCWECAVNEAFTHHISYKLMLPLHVYDSVVVGNDNGPSLLDFLKVLCLLKTERGN